MMANIQPHTRLSYTCILVEQVVQPRLVAEFWCGAARDRGESAALRDEPSTEKGLQSLM